MPCHPLFSQVGPLFPVQGPKHAISMSLDPLVQTNHNVLGEVDPWHGGESGAWDGETGEDIQP